MLQINPIRSSTVQEQVYEELLQAILSGRIAPGVRITIESVAKLMGVSLMPVRVALQKLETGGFITIGKNRRITVKRLTREILDEILQIRLMVECFAAEKACVLRSDAFIGELENLHQKCAGAAGEDAYLLANREFHGAIYRQAKMPLLDEIIGSLWQRLSPYLHILLRNDQQWRKEEFDEHHQGILEAIRDKDQKKMRKWLKKDLTDAAKLISEYLERVQDSEGGKT